jgi:double zinc ribbon protein
MMPGRFASLFARPPMPPPPDGAPPPEEDLEAAQPPPPPPPPQRPVPLGRERRELARQREIEIRDVGGLAVEMARRDDWRYELLAARCAEVLGIEERIHELDAMMTAVQIAARGVGAEQCRCGAPILRGAHFCSHCGRPAVETPPVVTCSHCGQPLPADVNFCPVCGNAVAAESFEAEQPVGDTFVAPVPPREGQSEGS